jgi:hypothetical protein
MTESDPPPQDDAAKIREGFTTLRVHVRLRQAGFADAASLGAKLHLRHPTLVPFGTNHYAAVRAVLDWDHKVPPQGAVLRVYTAYSQHEARSLETQLRARDQAIESGDLFPEFDIPDYAELESSEAYVCPVELPSLALGELQFAADWRREVRPPQARAAVSTVRELDAYRDAYRCRDNEALGGPVVIGWAPPALSGGPNWGVEVWLLTSFDGQSGRAMVFMVDVSELRVTRIYESDVHVG